MLFAYSVLRELLFEIFFWSVKPGCEASASKLCLVNAFKKISEEHVTLSHILQWPAYLIELKSIGLTE